MIDLPSVILGFCLGVTCLAAGAGVAVIYALSRVSFGGG